MKVLSNEQEGFPRRIWRCNRWAFVSAAVLLLATAGNSAFSQESVLQEIDSYIQSAMQSWPVPGLAVAIVKDDAVVLAKGYGVREFGKPDRVDSGTVFGLGSATKQITAAAIAILVDEGAMHWDDPVIEHLPDFRLYDAWVTQKVTIRDLLAHRVGIGRMVGNRIQYMSNAPRGELIYRMRYLQPDKPFRSGFVYQNVMYTAAGETVPAATGISWDDFVRSRIFEPLGMHATTTSIHQFNSTDPVASPHTVLDREITVIPFRDSDNTAPAGSVNSSVADMAQWLRLQLRGGVHEGRQLISGESIREMHTAQMFLPAKDGLASYGLGWRLSHYQGHAISAHGGGIDGMVASVMLVPEKQLGVVVLSNLSPNGLPPAISQWAVDRILGIETKHDWAADALKTSKANQQLADAEIRAVQMSRRTESSPTLTLDQYIGTYHDDLYGKAEVRAGDAGLELRFWGDEASVLKLEHWQHNSFRATWPNPYHGEKFIWFDLNQHAEVSALNVEWTLRPYPQRQVRVTRFHRSDDPELPYKTN